MPRKLRSLNFFVDRFSIHRNECPQGIDVLVWCFDILTYLDGMSDFCVYVHFSDTYDQCDENSVVVGYA